MNKKSDIKAQLQKSAPLGGIAGMIANTTPTATPKPKKEATTEPTPKAKTGQTKKGETRQTFILPDTIIADIKAIANYEGVQIKDVAIRIFSEYLKGYTAQPKKKPSIKTK